MSQHYDLGALEATLNYRGAERQLEILHNIGVNEIFDISGIKRVTSDFHLTFKDRA